MNQSFAETVGPGVVAGIGGTAVMTAFQKFVEMPLTGRSESYAPANFAEKMLKIHPSTKQGRKQLNWVTHFALGAMWGAAYGVAVQAGLRGPKAVGAVFAGVYMGDVALNTALGLYKPSTWSSRDWAIDVTDKLVQAAATGVLFEQGVGREARRLRPTRRLGEMFCSRLGLLRPGPYIGRDPLGNGRTMRDAAPLMAARMRSASGSGAVIEGRGQLTSRHRPYHRLL